MSSFSIDEVRDSFKSDLGLFLTSIHREAEAAKAAPALAPQALAPEMRPAFTRLGDLSHAVYGTSGLVGAESLHESARMLEELACAGEEAMVQMAAAAERARAIASACADGVAAMREMLAIELDHRSAAALALARKWLADVEHLRPASAPAPADALADVEDSDASSAPAPAGSSGPAPAAAQSFRVPSPAKASAAAPSPAAPSPAAPSPAAPSPAASPPAVPAVGSTSEPAASDVFEFSAGTDDVAVSEPAASDMFEFSTGTDEGAVDDGWHETAPASVFQFEERADPFSGELLEIFRSEGQETWRALNAALSQLSAQPGDMAAMSDLERLYHTMKGAASIVGLEEVSQLAAEIQGRLEGQLELGSAMNAESIAALVTETDDMLRRAGLPRLVIASPAPAPAEEGPQKSAAAAHHFFLEEVEELQGEAQGLLEELASSSSETSLRARVELGKLFHRLKGSALLVEETRVSGEAEKLQALFDQDSSASNASEELGAMARSALARIATLLGTEAPASVPATQPAATTLKPVREPVTVTAEPELWDAFVQESGELLGGLERESLALEESAQPRQVLEEVMNLLHTLKGVLNTVGLGPTAKLLHRAEDFVEDLIKAPILPPMRLVANLFLKVKADVHKNLREATRGYVETSLPLLETRMVKVLHAARGRADASASAAGTGSVGIAKERGNGASVHSIAEARSAKQSASLVPTPSEAGPGTRETAADHVDRKFIRVGTERLDSLMNLAGELVVSRSRLLDRVGTLRHLQRELGRGSLRLGDAVDEFRDTFEYFNMDGRSSPVLRRPPAAAPVAVPTGTDEGWESFGELELDRYEDVHILSRRLAEIASDVTELSKQLSRSLTTFNDDSQAFDSIVSGIQSEVTRARMVPLDLLFGRLRLPVRDAAAREEKEVRVVTEGAEVSIDKSIADGLFSPMLHLVRNSVVHGVESAAAREKAGKAAVGTITLAARQESGQIVLEVADDGAGLDLEALRACGARLGLLAADAPLSDPEIKDLVFFPGLSTRSEPGAVSGRGVGCDVVRRAVEGMNGSIRVETDTGRGARFVITLPVTLAISKALLVRSSDRIYALPLHFAERIIDTASEPIIESAGARRIKVDDAFINITHLEQHLGAPPTARSGPVLLLRVGEQREALQVDAVLGQEQIVVKSLGDILAGHPLFAGVTMRGSGQLVLILDVTGLMESKARRRERVAAGAAALPGRTRPGFAGAVQTPARKRRTRVLFVDDSLSVRKYAELTFASLGVDVTLAVDGMDALARLRGESFDMVFTDLEMPRMHGFELIRELRFVPAFKDLPIIVVTSRSGQKHKQQAKTLGASEYLTKPFSAEVLAQVMRRFTAPDGAEPKPVPPQRLPS